MLLYKASFFGEENNYNTFRTCQSLTLLSKSKKQAQCGGINGKFTQTRTFEVCVFMLLMTYYYYGR